jgi:hypothetical protein
MKPEVDAAIAELRDYYNGRVDISALPDGSAKILVRDLPLAGGPYVQQETWFGFTITYLHPYADIYPHFVRPDLTRRDGQPFGQSFQVGRDFYGQPATMLSRRTSLFGPEHPMNAKLKLEKVLQWLISP